MKLTESQVAAWAGVASSLKRLNSDGAAQLEAALSSALRRVYRAVAVDIDGTLLESSEDSISSDLAKQIADILYKGIPIVFITGRGHSTTKKICEDFRKTTGLPYWYLRRLYIIGYNGEFVLYTRTGSPEKFLHEEDTLIAGSIDKCGLTIALDRGLECKYESQDKGNHLRVFPADSDIDRVLQIVASAHGQFGRAFRSKYKDRTVIDCTHCSKDLALHSFAERLGVPAETILRIGDNGQEGGNDSEMLASASGFTVAGFSNAANSCFPVVDVESKQQLLGSKATYTVLSSTNILPPLSLMAANLERRKRALTGFEKLATQRHKDEERIATEQIRAKYRTLIPTGERFISSGNLMIGDIFDPLSGAVRLREWERAEVTQSHPRLAAVFNLSEGDTLDGQWVLNTDTAYLLRGAVYYHSLAAKTNEARTFGAYGHYCTLQIEFLDRCLRIQEDFTGFSITLAAHKMLLGIFDNLRNLALVNLYALFLFWEKQNHDEQLLRTRMHEVAIRIVSGFKGALFDPDYTGKRCLIELHSMIEVLKQLTAEISQLPIIEALKEEELFKYRECDYFLQNIVAAQIAMRDFARHSIFKTESATAVGIAYGGMEVPLLVECAGRAVGFNISTAFARMSLYGTKEEQREAIYRADQTYLERLGQTIKIVPSDRPAGTFPSDDVILCDDNCTTCLTLQAARDAFVYGGASVRGAIVIRYPSTNRIKQMTMDNHGFPEPENLLSFVRGLVAPSPYSRLVKPSTENKYANADGVFDKSKARIIKLIERAQLIEK